MESVEQLAIGILDVAGKIFKINEENNPQTIFKGKTFVINGEEVSAEQNDSKDSSYYFEYPEIDGVIIKDEDGNYSIKAAVRYENAKGNKWWFAKMRIDVRCDEVHIRGRRTGSWQMPDFADDDFMKNPDSELPYVLRSMKTSLCNMYDELGDNVEFGGDKYIPELEKRLLKYNGK